MGTDNLTLWSKVLYNNSLSLIFKHVIATYQWYWTFQF